MKLSASLLISTGAILHGVAIARETSPRIKEGKRDTIGMALAGGAFTAGNSGGAIMRGFQQQKIAIDGKERPAMEGFDYISGLSGGNFPNIMYAFARNTTSDEILDAAGISDPSLITEEELDNIPETSMFSAFTKSVWSLGFLPEAMFWSALFDSDFWATYVYLQFLEPFGIPHDKIISPVEDGLGDYIAPRSDVKATPVVEFSMVGPEELYPEWLYTKANVGLLSKLKAEVAVLSKVNEFDPYFEKYLGALEETYEIPFSNDFRTVNNSALLEYVKEHHYQIPVPFTGTPEEFGTSFPAGRMRFDNVSRENILISSEPLNFEPFYISPIESSSESKNFTLEHLLALGTALIPILGRSLGPEFAELLPSFFNDPLVLDVPTADGDKRTMAFADGGYNDNTGLPALVQRKVRNIILVTCTTPDNFEYNKKLADPIYWAFLDLSKYFGIVDFAPTFTPLDPEFFGAGIYFSNKLFDLYSNGENQLVKLLDNFKSLHAAGNPMITTLEDLTVIENPFWGTVAGEKVDLTVIHVFGVPKKFSDQVPRDVATPPEGKNFTENGFFTNEDLSFVPNLNHASDVVININIPETNISLVDFTIPGMEFALNPRGARMTQIMCSWMVKEAWNGLEGADGEMKFSGFKKIFEDEKTSAPTPGPDQETSAPSPDEETSAPTPGPDQETSTLSSETSGNTGIGVMMPAGMIYSMLVGLMAWVSL